MRRCGCPSSLFGDIQFHDWRDRARQCRCLFPAWQHRHRNRRAYCIWIRARRDRRRAYSPDRAERQASAPVRSDSDRPWYSNASHRVRYPADRGLSMNRARRLEDLLAAFFLYGTWSALAAIGLGYTLALTSSNMRMVRVGIALFILLP